MESKQRNLEEIFGNSLGILIQVRINRNYDKKKQNFMM